jgi:protease-4
MTPPGPRPAGTSSALGWKISVILLVLVLGLSLLFNVVSLFSGLAFTTGASQFTRGPRFDEIVLEDNQSRNKLLVIPIEGVITGQGYGSGTYSLIQYVDDQLDRAAKDTSIKAVLLKIDSPGGEVLASDDISKSVAQFQKETGKPVIASMGSVAASGGYYVAAPCRWIVANELTITGSIGVIMHSYNYRGLMDKVGMFPEVFKSGKFKDMMSGDKRPDDITKEERDMVQRLVDETYDQFKKVVADGRSQSSQANQDNAGGKGVPLVTNWADYADGRILSGKEAYQHGFVDELGSLHTAADRARLLTGISDANLVQFQQQFDFSNLFRMLGKSKGETALKLDLGIHAPQLPAGRLYFLSPALSLNRMDF